MKQRLFDVTNLTLPLVWVLWIYKFVICVMGALTKKLGLLYIILFMFNILFRGPCRCAVMCNVDVRISTGVAVTVLIPKIFGGGVKLHQALIQPPLANAQHDLY